MKRERNRGAVWGVPVLLLALGGMTSCRPSTVKTERPTLRLGVSNLPALSTERGVQQFVLNMTSEGLLRVNPQGRVEPWLAEKWERSGDGLRLTIRLRPGVTFHDGSVANAAVISKILNDQLPKGLKAFADDVESIVPNGDLEVVVVFKRPSSFFMDALMDVQIVNAGTPPSSVGPFRAAPAGSRPDGAQMIAYDNYYLGQPTLGGLAVTTYPNIRAAWADMLRGQLDMLYEVGAEAIDTMRDASNVSLYTFDRPYQYVVFLNTRSPKLKSREMRQALNEAIDRTAFVRDGLAGHGTPSRGPVSPHHWAFRDPGITFRYAPQLAAAKLPETLSLTCVTLAEAPFEQLALAVKQQLGAVGVDLQIVEAPLEEAFSRLTKNDFELVLLDSVSGWSLTRAHRWWHSKSASNVTRYSSPEVDAALDSARAAITDQNYAEAVATFQRAIAEDPPAIFLAWSERSRAISNQFDVQPEKGRDVLSTLRSWHRSTDKGSASRH